MVIVLHFEHRRGVLEVEESWEWTQFYTLSTLVLCLKWRRIGNGGSASTASHFVNDISLGSRQFENPFKAISLCDNQAVITAIANDDGYENIFLQQLQTQADAGDSLVCISASGNSQNLIKAIDWSKKHNIFTVSLTAFDGGYLKQNTDLNIHVPTKIGEYGPAEDLHMVICGLVGSYFRAIFKDSND